MISNSYFCLPQHPVKVLHSLLLHLCLFRQHLVSCAGTLNQSPLPLTWALGTNIQLCISLQPRLSHKGQATTVAHNIDPSAIAEILFSMIQPSLTLIHPPVFRPAIYFPRKAPVSPFSPDGSSVTSRLLTTLSTCCSSSHLSFLLLASGKIIDLRRPGNYGKNMARVKGGTKVDSRPFYSTSGLSFREE